MLSDIYCGNISNVYDEIDNALQTIIGCISVFQDCVLCNLCSFSHLAL